MRKDIPSHEMAAFLALGLMCGYSPFDIRIRLATAFEDAHRGTDMVLVCGRRKLYIDVTKTEAGVRAKIRRNKEFRKRNPRSRWPQAIKTSLEGPTTDVMVDGCFAQAWERLQSEEPVSFSVADICPKHGEDCPLVSKLRDLGQLLVIIGLDRCPYWQRYFQGGRGNWVWMR